MLVQCLAQGDLTLLHRYTKDQTEALQLEVYCPSQSDFGDGFMTLYYTSVS